MSTIVSPSLLSADFLHLERDVEMIERSAAEMIHFDVMDGVFVPNISFGFPVLDAVKSVTTKKLDVHYMIVHPERYIERTAKAGAYIMTVHVETCEDLPATLAAIRAAGMKAGVSLNPATPVEAIEPVLADCDMVLVMGVNPGYGGQKFIESTYEKVRQLRRIIDERGLDCFIEVDGGVNGETGRNLVACGAHALVSGNYVFRAADPIATIEALAAL